MEFWTVVLSGVIAASVMAGFLTIVHRSNLANADMIRAVGSLFTRSEKNAFPAGLLLHYCAGVIFAFLYATLVTVTPINTSVGIIVLCLGASTFHGLIVSMALVIAVAEHHPIGRFKRAGPDVVLVHFFAHHVYGISLGLCFVLFGFRQLFN